MMIFPVQGANLLPFIPQGEEIVIEAAVFSGLKLRGEGIASLGLSSIVLGSASFNPALSALEAFGNEEAGAESLLQIQDLFTASGIGGLELGNSIDNLSLSALEIEKAEGIHFVIDVIDEILASAAGDCEL